MFGEPSLAFRDPANDVANHSPPQPLSDAYFLARAGRPSTVDCAPSIRNWDQSSTPRVCTEIEPPEHPRLPSNPRSLRNRNCKVSAFPRSPLLPRVVASWIPLRAQVLSTRRPVPSIRNSGGCRVLANKVIRVRGDSRNAGKSLRASWMCDHRRCFLAVPCDV